MKGRLAQVAVTAAVLIGAGALLFSLTLQSDAQYYKRVDEVMASPAEWYGKPMRLHGYVVDGTLLKRTSSLDYRFEVENGPHKVLATYTGIVPDTFKEGAEVVLKGRLGPDGFHVETDGVMAKCPSKYEAGK